MLSSIHSNIPHYVDFVGRQSKHIEVEGSLPEDWVLGLLLSTVYVNDIFRLILPLKCTQYADESTFNN